MTIHYSPSTRGFYTTEIHGDNVPGDAVEVSGDQYAALMGGQASGQQISPGVGGVPELVDAQGPGPLAQIAALESATMIPRVTREFMIAAMELEGSRMTPPVTPEALYLANIGYRRLRDMDEQIATLRAEL